MRLSFSRMVASAVLSFAPLTPTVSAQGTFRVEVTPHLVSNIGDVIAMTYTVRVVPPTTDSLVGFIVDAPSLVSVGLPGPRASWLTLSKWRTRAIASWTRLDVFTGAGDSTPPLPMTARGVIGVVPFWAERNAPLDTVVTDLVSDTSAVFDTLIVVNGMQGTTIGVVPFPADQSPAALANRLASFVDQVCTLGWIDNHGICNSLRVKATTASGPLGAMLNELSAQRGKHVSEAAYVLLSENARFLLSRL